MIVNLVKMALLLALCWLINFLLENGIYQTDKQFFIERFFFQDTLINELSLSKLTTKQLKKL